MKDDSLSDVAKSKGYKKLHSKVDINVDEYKAAVDRVNRATDREVWNEPPQSVGNAEPDPLLAKYETAQNVYEREIWNKAIEAAANVAEINSAAEIRRLRK